MYMYKNSYDYIHQLSYPKYLLYIYQAIDYSISAKFRVYHKNLIIYFGYDN